MYQQFILVSVKPHYHLFSASLILPTVIVVAQEIYCSAFIYVFMGQFSPRFYGFKSTEKLIYHM